jgi:hypothetical protein
MVGGWWQRELVESSDLYLKKNRALDIAQTGIARSKHQSATHRIKWQSNRTSSCQDNAILSIDRWGGTAVGRLQKQIWKRKRQKNAGRVHTPPREWYYFV